jgi:threonine dehydratase
MTLGSAGRAGVGGGVGVGSGAPAGAVVAGFARDMPFRAGGRSPSYNLDVVTADDVRAATGRIAGHVRRTPTLRLGDSTRSASARDVTLKLENLQVTGSFKPRGALNALLAMPRAVIEHGVVTASGGNHGQGVAYAARRLGVPATVYVPETAPLVKQ